MAGAGYRDWTAGDIPTATQFDTYLQHQTVMVFASAAARDTALSTVKANGMMAYTTDSSRLQQYDGTIWQIVHEPRQTWNVTNLTQSGSVACTTTRGWYQRTNGSWRGQLAVVVSGTGTTNNPVTLTLPLTLLDANDAGGSFTFQDVSGGLIYEGTIHPQTTFVVSFQPGSNPAGLLGVVPNVAIGVGDVLRVTIQGTYA